MSAKITLKDISRNLNISISTVSRALKGHPDISEETREKVMRLAALMDYEPNTYAISLRTNKSNIFGIIVPEISNFFYHSFISAVEEESKKIGFSLLILQSGNDPLVEAENIRLCRLNRVAGVLISVAASSKDMSRYQKLEENGVPIIFFDKVPDVDACNKVCLADEDAAVLAATALQKKGKQHILAIFGHPDISITQKRKLAFINAMEKNKQAKLIIAHAGSSRESFEITKTAFLASQQPDAVFCMSDEILTGTMKAMQLLKINIPNDTGIISISNDDFIPHLYEPEITYIETSGYQLGKLAFERISDYMSGKKFYRELILPSKLVEGNSL
ncbi:MAG: substrate-binding domain-containing protein [Terrimonas sp.]|nr:substrate-binding domain-containing protein [Terrimonas sp.]